MTATRPTLLDRYQSAARWLEIYADHTHDHADQIRRARRGEA